MAKKRNNQKNKKSLNFVQRYNKFRRFVQDNTIVFRTVSLGLASVVLIAGVGTGIVSNMEYTHIQAITLTPAGQTATLPLSNVTVELGHLYRHGNYTVVPFSFGDTDDVSLQAKDYRVVIEPADKEVLDPKTQGTIMFFGTTGEAALILKGKMPVGPVTMIIMAKKVIASNASSTGTATIAGKQVKTKRDVVSFTINARGKNVREAKDLTYNASPAYLYRLVAGQAAIHHLYKEINSENKQLKTYDNQKAEYMDRLNTLAKTTSVQDVKSAISQAGLNIDTSQLGQSTSSSSSSSSDSDDDAAETNDPDASDTSTSSSSDTLSDVISQISSIQSSIDGIHSTVKSLKDQIKKENTFIKSMDEISNVSNNGFSIGGN